MLLIATLINYPGIGCREDEESTENHHNALALLQNQMEITAKNLPINIEKPAVATLRKDLETLREMGILEKRMYRWGYYLGTGVMNKQELKIAFDALESMAIYQGDTVARQIHSQLKKRIKGLDINKKEDFFYPIRKNLNRAINYTDSEEMILTGRNQRNLYHRIPELETAIIKGQAIEISRKEDLFNQGNIGLEIIIPLQLIYYNIAWYLVYENCVNNQLIIGRVNRFSNYFKVVSLAGRHIEAQKESLKKTEFLLKNGWGLNLGNKEEQELELQGKLTLEKIKVRFYPPVSQFIKEGELRHSQQSIKLTKNSTDNKILYLDYFITLPPRSLNEFLFWLQGYGSYVEVIYPESLRKEHKKGAIELTKRYD
jgi:predicted DNA-binding transcriptional regulator YafY